MHEICHFGYFLIIFTSKRYKWIHFLVVLFNEVFWKDMSHLTYFVCSLRGFEWVIWSQSWSKLHEIWHFLHFSIIFTSKKIKVNPFSDCTILLRLLGEYEPSSVLYCYCKRLSSGIGAYGPKIGQNYMKYDILGTFRTFSLKKDRNESIYW